MKNGKILIWAGLAISIIFLFLLFRKIDFNRLMEALQVLDWRYLAGAVALTFASYWLRAVRWRFLLVHEKQIPLRSLYSAVIIGYMANNLFPARMGEFVRSWLLAEREKLPVAAVFASLVIDRLVDGMTVMFMLLFVIVTIELPPGMEQASVMLKTGGATTLLLYAVVVFFLLFLKARPVMALRFMALIMRPFPATVSERLIPVAGSFLEGLRFSTDSSNIIKIVSSSILIWITATVPIDLVLKGFGIHLPIAASFFIMVLLVLAVMVPAAPGYVGTYHAACYTGLAAFNVPDTQAVGIALVIHGVGFFPVIFAGAWHIWSDGISLRRIREQAASTAEH